MTRQKPSKTLNGRRPRCRRGSVHLSLSYPALVGLALVLIAPSVLALVIVTQNLGRDPSHNATHAATGSLIQGTSGPWGDPIYIPIHIWPPDEFVEASNGYPPGSTWYFPNCTSSQVQAVFADKDVTDAQRAAIQSAIKASPEINGQIVKPPDAVVRGLSPEARSRIYRILVRYPLNRAQTNAFRFCGDSPEEWLGNSDLRPEIRDLVKSLTYRNGKFMLFADLPLVEPLLKTQEEKHGLLRAVSQESTFVMRLRIDDNTDVKKLIEYWGRGGRTKDVRPILESMAELQGEQFIPVVTLLPPFARARLYTYPSVAEDSNASHRDCHWSALNFFNDQPDDRLADRQYASSIIEKDYYVIYSGYALGDLVLYMTGPGEVIHTAVYLADGVLFTKNGSRPSNPWMLIRMDDMRDFYPSEKPITVQVLRRKGI
jgi:hypothetical protein